MYTPAHFAASDDAIENLLRHSGAANLVTMTPDGLLATLLPFVYNSSVGEHGALQAHMARNNPQWSTPATGEALMILQGPDAYISPSWYASKTEHGRVVPTWNYTTAHVYGRVVVHDDGDWLGRHVRQLSDHHESVMPRPGRWTKHPSALLPGS